ncbi:18070_t:CDS:10, partial [Racocetra fulgida]
MSTLENGKKSKDMSWDIRIKEFIDVVSKDTSQFILKRDEVKKELGQIMVEEIKQNLVGYQNASSSKQSECLTNLIKLCNIFYDSLTTDTGKNKDNELSYDNELQEKVKGYKKYFIEIYSKWENWHNGCIGIMMDKNVPYNAHYDTYAMQRPNKNSPNDLFNRVYDTFLGKAVTYQDLLEEENQKPSKKPLEEPSKESEIPRKKYVITKKLVPKEKFTEVKKLKPELDKSLKLKKGTSKRKLKNNISIMPEIRVTALYCDAKIVDKIFPLIVDSESSRSVVLSHFLRELENKWALEEISAFPFEVEGVKVPIDFVVTDATSYQAKARIDWTAAEMLFEWEDKEIVVLSKLYEDNEDKIMTAGTLTDEDEFDDEDLEDRIYGVSSFDDFLRLPSLAMFHNQELCEEPEMSWDSEDEYCTDLISFDSADETNENCEEILINFKEESDESCDEILVSSLPPLYQDLDELTLTITLSTIYLLGEDAEPIVNLLDFYYEEKTPDIVYRVSKLPQNFQDQFDNFLQNH